VKFANRFLYTFAHHPPLWRQRDAGAASGFHVQIQLPSWFRSFSSKRWLDSAQLNLVEHDVFLPLFLSIYNVIICNCIILCIYIYTVCIDARSFWIILSLLTLNLNQLPSLLHLPAPSAIVFEQKRGTNL
jgi:hypothetical protein